MLSISSAFSLPSKSPKITELDINECLLRVLRAIEGTESLLAEVESRKAHVADEKAAAEARVLGLLRQRAQAAYGLLDGQLRQITDWRTRASALADELQRTLRGTQSWPSPQGWASVTSRVQAIVSQQPARLDLAALEGWADSDPRPSPIGGPALHDTTPGTSAVHDLLQQLQAEREQVSSLRADLAAARRDLEGRDRACRQLESAAATLRYQLQASMAQRQASEAARDTAAPDTTAGASAAQGSASDTELRALESNLERMLGDKGTGASMADPMQLLRDACGAGDGVRERGAGGAVETGAGAGAGVGGGEGESAVRDQYRRALLAMRARYERERDMLQARIKEMTEKHREELKRAGALPEDLAAEARADALASENARLREALAAMREGAEADADYRLYRQRAQMQGELVEMKERYHRDMESARAEMADLRRELGAFRDGDWAREALRVEAAVKDAQVRAALVEAQARHEQNVAGLVADAGRAIHARDEGMGALLEDLRRMQRGGGGAVGAQGAGVGAQGVGSQGAQGVGTGAGGAGGLDDDMVTPYHTMADAVRLVAAAQRALEESRGAAVDGGGESGRGQGVGGGEEVGRAKRVGYMNAHTLSHVKRDPVHREGEPSVIQRAVAEEARAVGAAVRWADEQEGAGASAAVGAGAGASGGVNSGVGLHGNEGPSGGVGGGGRGDESGREGRDGGGEREGDASAWKVHAILSGASLEEDEEVAGDRAVRGALRGLATAAEKQAALQVVSRHAPRPAQPPRGGGLPPRPPPTDRERAAGRVDAVLGKPGGKGGGGVAPGATPGVSAGVAGGAVGGAGAFSSQSQPPGLFPRDPFAPGRPDGSLSCVRCGGNDATCPGECRFHPALVQGGGPFLYGVEWQECKAAGHKSGTPGCYVRKDHFYPTGVLQSILTGASDTASVSGTVAVTQAGPAVAAGGGAALHGARDGAGAVGGGWGEEGPRPRSRLPQPLRASVG